VSDGPWSAVLGQPAATAALRAALANEELAHAWLLVGPRHVGQVEIARALGSALNCPTPTTPDVGCGVCSACRRILEDKHPAVLDMEPEGAFHRVDDVREVWIKDATRTMTEGRRRVVRIIAADRMNEAAQNAFLKILEEPPPSVVWVLEVQEDAALLDTVISRCRRLDLVPFGPAALLQRAAEWGVPEEHRDALVRASLGLPERLYDLADPDIASARWRHLAILDRLATGGPGQVIPLAKELVTWARGRAVPLKEKHAAVMVEMEEDFGVEGSRGWPPGIRQRLTKKHDRLEKQEQRRALDIVLDDIGSYLRDLLAVQSGAGSAALVNVDHEAALQRDALRLPAPAAVRGIGAVAACRDALDRNGAPELQLERLLLALALPIYATSAA
jgi:DNA polymerase III subunit delta'